ncbi:hypothetical protein AYI69_g10060 [Smittium culicis]|uniref:Uncharacterized protein n=1 Tax=Smittium culicis TaxID=133412 RepID=A0A1R1X8D0_9FUNG|nr:hypothetical protein AYI69_g10060 [Smittium culicis]
MDKEFLRDKMRNAEPEDTYVTTRIPLADLAVYLEHIEALLSIEENVFSLAQANRPIDYYFYRRIQENPQITDDNQHVLFYNTLIVLISDIAATVNQERFRNLRNRMELPGKLLQLIEPETKPHMDQEKLEALITARIQRSNLESEQTEDAATPTSTAFNHSQKSSFRGEGVVEKGGLSRPHRGVPGKRPPRDVSVNIDQIDGEQVGSQHHREGVSDHILAKGKIREGFGGKSKKSFCRAGPLGWPKTTHTWLASTKRLEKFGEIAASPTTAGGVS